MRLFIAIELPERVKKALCGLKAEMPGVRWLAPDLLHLTLLFLGNVAEEQAVELKDSLSEIRAASFTLTTAQSGFFPNAHHPRVIWAGLEHQPALNRLAERIRAKVVSCGIALEERPFRPHITLARVARDARGDFAGFLRQTTDGTRLSFEVREFVLFRSTFTQQGAVHQALQRFEMTTALP